PPGLARCTPPPPPAGCGHVYQGPDRPHRTISTRRTRHSRCPAPPTRSSTSRTLTDRLRPAGRGTCLDTSSHDTIVPLTGPPDPPPARLVPSICPDLDPDDPAPLPPASPPPDPAEPAEPGERDTADRPHSPGGVGEENHPWLDPDDEQALKERRPPSGYQEYD